MLAEAYLRSGKVRDLYRLNDGRVVLVASDRISAFDVVLPTLIPDKGRVLTAISRFWFKETASIIESHLLTPDVRELESTLVGEVEAAGGSAADLGSFDELRGRVMLCRSASVVPIEAVVRGYLSGSGWKEYQATGTVCGIALPTGLRESDRLPHPIFTPATKAELGDHDENIDFERMVDHLAAWELGGRDAAAEVAERIRDVSLRLYGYASAVAARRGIVLADTKFEFGFPVPGERSTPAEGLMLIDEALTPDSSRFWDAAAYEPGRPQASFDKQYVRDWLETQPWGKTAPGPALPDDVVEGTRARYVEAYERITGASFKRYLEEDVIAS